MGKILTLLLMIIASPSLAGGLFNFWEEGKSDPPLPIHVLEEEVMIQPDAGGFYLMKVSFYKNRDCGRPRIDRWLRGQEPHNKHLILRVEEATGINHEVSPGNIYHLDIYVKMPPPPNVPAGTYLIESVITYQCEEGVRTVGFNTPVFSFTPRHVFLETR